jgi:hypothetical protein
MNRKITVKKMTFGSEEFNNDDAWYFEGTTQERWDNLWKLLLTMNPFTKHYADFTQPLRRDVVKIIRG